MFKVLTKNFNIKHILECGQIFRFHKVNDDEYVVFSDRKRLRVKQINYDSAIKIDKEYNYSDNNDYFQNKNTIYDDAYKIVFFDCDKNEFYDYWEDFFDFKTNYSAIKNNLKYHGEELCNAMDYGDGIRILNQNKFETIISFIVSANNNISRIQKIMFKICEKYGDKLLDANNNEYYAFPNPQVLSSISVEELRNECNVGYRDKYIVQTAELICNNVIDVEEISKLSTLELVGELKKLSGIGQKVADCIALFAYGRREVFPVDVWTKRVFENLYVGHELPKNHVHVKVHEIFGEYAGYVQQYLFYYGRETF